jgi:hypothetical protein
MTEDPKFGNYSTVQLTQRYVLSSLAYGSNAVIEGAFEIIQAVGYLTYDTSECSWLGVQCDENDAIVAFELVDIPEAEGPLLPEMALLSNLGGLICASIH